jgi:sugar phosphate isomerase/epimerase
MHKRSNCERGKLLADLESDLMLRGLPGEGTVEWDKVFQTLKEIDYEEPTAVPTNRRSAL